MRLVRVPVMRPPQTDILLGRGLRGHQIVAEGDHRQQQQNRHAQAQGLPRARCMLMAGHAQPQCQHCQRRCRPHQIECQFPDLARFYLRFKFASLHSHGGDKFFINRIVASQLFSGVGARSPRRAGNSVPRSAWRAEQFPRPLRVDLRAAFPV